ncbi:hypothetical protein GPECTOR_1g730 [Gonium pectorale]|uniref:Uncharacterized protein n=1 Tax=Gonium pectorale TaxID=33097 RepID=A0A150H426_GONPE|nr:hypothetical protein GPECTOR_1g730 [Gonium pectorale]|eukprot:KXZ56811.1 hypothetical protein GPECTOR_1g730 [Gonium pectorale]
MQSLQRKSAVGRTWASSFKVKRPSKGITNIAWPQLAAGAVAGFCAWLSSAGTATAGVEDPTTVVGPTTDVLLGGGDHFSFTSLLLFTLITYWLLKALYYLSRNSASLGQASPPWLDGPEGTDDTPGDQQQQKQRGLPPGMGDVGHAHIRSYVDPAAASGADARELRNASLARSAAFRVAATVRESLPRIHALVEQLAGSSAPPPQPHNAGIDPVADLVYARVLQELRTKGHESGLNPRERAALETILLEEVAAQCAREQVADFERMAAEGKLSPHQPGGGGGAGHAPHSHAH